MWHHHAERDGYSLHHPEQERHLRQDVQHRDGEVDVPRRAVIQREAHPQHEHDEEADAKRQAEARADIDAGRLIPNEEVCAWLETWGTPDEKLMRQTYFPSPLEGEGGGEADG